MFKRLPFLCAALLAVAACSQQESGGAPAPAASAAPAASTPSQPAAPASAAGAAGSGSAAAPAASAPAPAGTAAPAAASTAPAAASAPSAADDAKWVEGSNYFAIEPAQPTSHPGKVEVTEVFSYGCPACNQFHPIADQLAASLPANAVMVYLPASFIPQENWPTLQRAYITAQSLGVADKAHDAMFDAVWKSGELSAEDPQTGRLKSASALPTIDDIAKVYAKFGVDPKEFAAVANSFTVNTKMKRADELIRAYGVEETPTIVIDGKYRFTPRSAGDYGKTLELAKYLIAKAAASK